MSDYGTCPLCGYDSDPSGHSHAAAELAAWRAAGSPLCAAAYAAMIMTAIDADIAAGLVPATVSSFGELHGYLDANDYAAAVGVPRTGPPDEPYAMVNRVETEVCRRLTERAGAQECDACKHNRELLERGQS